MTKHVLIDSHVHQQETPIWGAVRKETLFSENCSTLIQYGGENSTNVEELYIAAVRTAWPWDSSV